MTLRLIGAVSILALVTACSSQPGPSSFSSLQQGEAALRAGNFPVAEQVFTSVLATNPNDPSAMLGLAQVYEASDRSVEAVELYSKVAAAQSGAIRVWNDGQVMQEGVTEVASRRLGALGHGMDTLTTPPVAVAPVPALEVVATSSPVIQTEVWPENPVYGLDADGMIFYADPEATQPVTIPVFESREVAERAAPVVTHSIEQTFEPIAQIVPVVQETFVAPVPTVVVPVPIAPAPVVQTIVQPQEPVYALDSNGTVYFADPAATQPIAGAVFESREAAEQAAPAVARQTISSAAPTVPAPVQYAPATVVPAPTIQSFAPVPIVNQAPAIVAPVFAPLPTSLPSINTSVPTPTAALPRSQPGYAVVNGDFVYISAEDIARAAGTPTPVANLGSTGTYSLPTQASFPSIPAIAPQNFTVPSGVNAPALPPLIELNGIPNLNLN